MARIRKRKARKPSVLSFKFRIIPQVRMPRSVMFQHIEDFMRTGVMSADIELVAADFGRSRSLHVPPGKVYDVESLDMAELRNLYKAFKDAASVRFEKVD